MDGMIFITTSHASKLSQLVQHHSPFLRLYQPVFFFFTQRVALIICCSTLGNLNLSATVTSQVFTAVQKKWYNTR